MFRWPKDTYFYRLGNLRRLVLVRLVMPHRVCIFAIFLLCSCAQGDQNQAAQVDEEPDAVRSAVPEFIAYRSEARFPVPDTWDEGVFSLNQGCLVFETNSGQTFMPILPPNLRVIGETATDGRDGLSYLVIGRNYRVTGGEGTYILPNGSPKQCQYKQFLVGEIK